jgi:pimeloyl-ACP methyl ester carboxylesterase
MDGVREFLERRLGGDRAETELPADSDAVALAEELAANPETITLDDGRQLGYAETGDPDGDPLVLYHGFPNSRVFGALFDDAGRERGVRVVTPDRPGMGVSDPDPDRTLLDCPEDVRQLLDALDIDEAPVVGISGGGPYAAATAVQLESRVPHVGIVCGLGPMAAVGLRARLWYYTARFTPTLSKAALWLLVQRARGDPAEWLESLAEDAHPTDEELWQGDVGQILHASAVEAHRHHGLDPLVHETALYGSPWPFDLDDVEVPVTLWYGKADTLVPVEMGLYLAREIPTAEAHFYPELDHLSTVATNEDDILRTVMESDGAR